MPDECPTCHVDLEDRTTDVWCPRCGWTVRDVDNPREYVDRAHAIAERDAWGAT